MSREREDCCGVVDRFVRVHVPILVGLGRGIVIATGDRTVMGRIANLASDTNISATTMAREMQSFVNIIIIASAFMGIGFLVVLLALGYDWIVAFVFLIGILMGNVPEGLLTTVTVGAVAVIVTVNSIISTIISVTVDSTF